MRSSPTTNSAIEVSVVIATYDREARLAFALDALAEQTVGPDRFEVIVVRDSEEGPLTTPPDGLDVRFLTVPGPGPAIRRNRGWRAAKAPLIAFTDDDCRPAADWLETLLSASAGDTTVLQGRTIPDPDEVHLYFGLARTIDVDHPDGWYATCNMAYSRALLERIGGFDEELSFHCEDTDLGLRAEAAGAQPSFAPDAIVYHCVKARRLRDALVDAIQRKGEPALLARHPHHRERLYLRVFHRREHATLLLAIGGLLLLRRSPLLAALCIYPHISPRVRRRLRRSSPASPMGWVRLSIDLAVDSAVDLVEIGARTHASIRHRRLVL